MTARAWTIGLSTLASLVLGIALMVHGDAIDQAGLQGSGWMAWGVILVLIPVLTGSGAVVVFLGREISKDIRKERAWKQTLTPQQRTAVRVAETAALYATWAAVHHAVKESKARHAAEFQERSAASQARRAEHDRRMQS